MLMYPRSGIAIQAAGYEVQRLCFACHNNLGIMVGCRYLPSAGVRCENCTMDNRDCRGGIFLCPPLLKNSSSRKSRASSAFNAEFDMEEDEEEEGYGMEDSDFDLPD